MIGTKFKISISIFFAVAILFNGANATFATEKCVMPQSAQIKPQIDWPASPLTQKTLSETTNIPQLIQYFFEWGVGLGGLAVFIALIIAGIEYITSIADPNKLKDAKDRIKSSLIGLVLLLSSWAIFNLINPALNTLKDISNYTGNVMKGGVATDIDCNFNWDCCKIPDCNPSADCTDPNSPTCCMDPNCAPENFACCQKNDSQCIAKKKPRVTIGATPYGKKPNGETSDCIYDTNCQENYCYCDRSKNPWKQYCKANPKVCINIIGESKLGCDYIAFYDAPGQLQGTEKYYEITGSDSGWVTPTGSAIKSYQAFQAAKNQKGEYIDDAGVIVSDKNMAKKVPCGRNSCGCQLTICEDPNATLYSCIAPVDLGAAFNDNVDGDWRIVKVQDETKGAFATVKKEVTPFLDWLLGK
jgi:hypothetical protein